MKITNYARSAPKISDQGGGPMSPWEGLKILGMGGGGQVLMGGITPGWGRVPPPYLTTLRGGVYFEIWIAKKYAFQKFFGEGEGG